MSHPPSPVLENADLQWQESDAPFSSRFGDIYFSREGGLAETEHVFLAANRLRERWKALDEALARGDPEAPQVFTIGELGFGTGLNFLCTWRAWQALSPRYLRLHFVSCERFPLTLEALRRALAAWPELAPFADALLQHYPDHSAGLHRLPLLSASDQTPVLLDLYYGDASEMLAAQERRTGVQVDAWFLDGFAPRVNPDMWQEGLLREIARLSGPGTTLSTYSVAGAVTRGLDSVGFRVAKQPGFGKKREMLVGTMADAPCVVLPPRWLAMHRKQAPVRRVAIIGAGIAGCAAAHSLARRGFQVTVFERAADIAQGGSGNRQAVLQCRLSNALNGSRQFNLHAFLYAVRSWDALALTHPGLPWHRCGVLNLATAFSARQKKCDAVDVSRYSAALARVVDADTCGRESALALDEEAVMQPLGGWVAPHALCRAYLDHPAITLQTGTAITHLQRDSAWQGMDEEGREIFQAEAVLIANSTQLGEFSQTAPIPLRPIRGQVTYLAAGATSRDLKTVICGQSYLSPAFEGLHSVGASYSRHVEDLAMKDSEHLQNLAGIAQHLPTGTLDHGAIAGGRVGVRATTSDRMPVVGPVPDFDALKELYLALNQSARKRPPTTMPYLPGLYVSAGHGSHGFTNAPLAGEIIASLIANEMLPVTVAGMECIHPARFILRELRRQGVSHQRKVAAPGTD